MGLGGHRARALAGYLVLQVPTVLGASKKGFIVCFFFFFLYIIN